MEKEKMSIIPDINSGDVIPIKNFIYNIRNQQVMLDNDLAVLYQVETKRLNEAARRNIARFPERYRFRITEAEFNLLRSQFATSKAGDDKESRGGRRYLPYCYTDYGVAMLSSVLRSDIAITVSIRIIDSFIDIRRYTANTTLLNERLTSVEIRQNKYQQETEERFEKVFDYIASHEESEQRVFFDGQIYDAFSLIADLIYKADSKILLIDNYVDINTLNLLAKKKDNVAVTIYTLNNGMLTSVDINTFNAQYPVLNLKYTNKFHDRFLIIDDMYGYHIGASIKDAGKKCFAINIMQDISIILSIL